MQWIHIKEVKKGPKGPFYLRILIKKDQAEVPRLHPLPFHVTETLTT